MHQKLGGHSIRIPLIISYLLFSICCLLPQDQLQASPDDLVIGMELAFPPFEMLDTSGKPAGVSVEMARALADYLHRPLRIENIPFDGLIPSLKTGKIDLAISSMTKTADRAKSIDFSDPYLTMGLAILVKKDSPIQSIADVDKPNITVAVKKATTGHIYAIQHFHNAKILVFNDAPTCATEVAQGKADCMIYDQISIFQHWKSQQDTTRAILKPFQTEEWAIGIRKGNDELREQVNAFLKQFKDSGGFNQLGNKYFGENKKLFEQLGIPFYF
jgi:polar amino acid transport system substrate-binding protein